MVAYQELSRKLNKQYCCAVDGSIVQHAGGKRAWLVSDQQAGAMPNQPNNMVTGCLIRPQSSHIIARCCDIVINLPCRPCSSPLLPCRYSVCTCRLPFCCSCCRCCYCWCCLCIMMWFRYNLLLLLLLPLSLLLCICVCPTLLLPLRGWVCGWVHRNLLLVLCSFTCSTLVLLPLRAFCSWACNWGRRLLLLCQELCPHDLHCTLIA